MTSDLEWIILAGGKGSRSANPKTPKILQDVGGKTILDLLISSLDRLGAERVTFSLSHEGAQVVDYLKSVETELVWTTVLDEGGGPVNALKLSSSQAKSESIGCVLGDTALSVPFDLLLQRHESSGKRASVVVRQSNHINDSDIFEVSNEGETMAFWPKGQLPNKPQGNYWAASGILFMEKAVAMSLDGQKPDVVAALVDSVGPKGINIIQSSYYHRDSGTIERLDGVSEDFRRGIFAESSGWNESGRPALFIDRDGTILDDLPEGRTNVCPEDLREPIVRVISEAKNLGVPVFMVTNQPAIAKGQIDVMDVYAVHNKIQQILVSSQNTCFDEILFCPHHPEGGHSGENKDLKITCYCRKPNPGMLIELADKHSLDLSKSLVIGDSLADHELADNAGARFVHNTEVQQFRLIEWLNL